MQPISSYRQAAGIYLDKKIPELRLPFCDAFLSLLICHFTLFSLLFQLFLFMFLI